MQMQSQQVSKRGMGQEQKMAVGQTRYLVPHEHLCQDVVLTLALVPQHERNAPPTRGHLCQPQIGS